MKHLKILLVAFLYCGGLTAQDNLDDEELLSHYFDMGYDQMFVEKDSAYYYFEVADSLAIKIKDEEWQLYILSYYIYTSDYHFDLDVSNDILRRTQNLLSNDWLKTDLEDYKSYETAHLLNTANYFYKLKEFEKAKRYFLELLSSFHQRPASELSLENATDLFRINNFLAGIYKQTGKYALSEQYFLKNIALIDENRFLVENKEAYLTNVNQLLAQLYVLLDYFEKANELFNSGIDTYKNYYKSDKKFKNNLINVYQRATQNYIEQDSLKKALFYLDESQGYLIQDDPFYKEALVLYGDVYSELKKDRKAMENYEKALQAFLEYRKQKPHQDIAEVHGKIAEFHLERENYSEGLRALQKALNNSGSSINLGDYSKNPDSNEVFSKRQLLQLLDIKLQLLQIAYSKTGDKQFLDAALVTNKGILNTFDLLKKEFESKLDKQFLAETAYPIFHRMLEVSFEAYQQNKSPRLFELALNISEKNKDFLLLEALRNANATEYGGIPKNIVEKEARLRAEISNSEKNLFDSAEEETDYSGELFELKQEYYGFLDTLESKYPKYHDLKYQSTALTIGAIRNSLESAEVLVSFTMAADHLYALILNDNTKDFLKLPFNESDREAVRGFYKFISNPTIKNNNQEISEFGANLYNKILKLPLTNFESQNLTIIPDDVLHYLPFDLLVEDNELLLQSKFIGYGNSISSYLELKEKQKGATEKLLAFAPSFDNQIVESEIRFEFGKLLYNDDEVKKIGSVFESEIYSNNDATLERFKMIASEFDVIHLATHASANDEYPDYSYLAFSEDEGESNILYIKDLYNMVLNSEMVTLSACQTGIGKLQKGQGMMSLSKGFFYAGAKSLVNTLWKINDKSSVKLMEFFYEGLSKGKNKKEALRDAKLKYLATTDDNLLKHPYYWSAFVVSGDTAPITNTDHWLFFGIGGALIVLLMTFVYSKRKVF